MDGVTLNHWFYGDLGGEKDCMNLADDDFFTEVQYGQPNNQAYYLTLTTNPNT